MMNSIKIIWLLFYFTLFANSAPSGNETLPKELPLNIAINSTFTLTLNLVEKKGEVEEPEVVVKEKGKTVVTPADEAEHMARYADRLYNALFTVTLASEKLTYRGSFYLDGVEFNLILADFDEKALGEKLLEERVVEIDGRRYKLGKLKPTGSLNFQGDEAAPPETGVSLGDLYKNNNNTNINNNNNKNNNKISKQSRGKQDLVGEIMVVIDYSTYRKFLGFSKGNDAKAMEQIKYYYTHLFNGVNDNYQRIKNAKFSITMTVVVLYVAKTRSDAIFTTKGNIVAGPNLIHTANSLLTFWHWVKRNVNKWPRIDMAVMFHEQESSTEILGLAYIKTVCNGTATAMVKNLGNHELIACTTHEIGHLMGAWHDGDKNTCDNLAAKLMASATFGGSTDYQNEQVFSRCSVNYFSKHISDLNKAGTNCMLDKPSSSLNPLNANQNSRKALGQEYSLEAQCKMTYGPESYFCGGEVSGNELCTEMVCYDPKIRKCFVHSHLRAYDGSSCGDRKWCKRGVCVQDRNAPSMTAKKCRYGDSKAILPHHTLKNLRCTTILNSMNSLCYRDIYLKSCCKTCEIIKKRNPANCFYGDKDPTCKGDHCHTASYKKRCCKSCATVNPNGCYPKYPKWCSKKKASDCYNKSLTKSCCQTCKSFMVSNTPGCEYGDKADYCPGEVKNDRSNCDEASFRDVCCHSCR